MELQSHSPQRHIALFPCVGFGHFIPAAEFAKRLCALHGFRVTIITIKWMRIPKQDAYVHRLASSGLDIRFAELPDVPFPEDQDDSMKIETRISKFMNKAKPYVGDVLQSLLNSSLPISAFVTDFFCTSMFDVAGELGIPTYIFFTNNATVLSLMFLLPKLASEIQVSFKDVDFAVEVPGLLPILSRDLPTPLQDRSDDAFYWFVHHSSRFHEAAGILINTFAELEEDVVNALREGKVLSSSAAAMPSIYPVGPLISSKSDRPDDSECLKWLDQQPPSSVLFVSFGSGATLSVEQIAELALGLEASGHRFLWVVRGPHKYITFAPKEETSVSHLLPEGFESRTKDRGLVVPFWAPQIPVLSHPSTGGFFSHSGWNSTLESISHGVPIISWPFFAEQRLNRFLLVNQYKVAIEAKTEPMDF
uniref:Glycosyltransferase n=1 Tax=Wollemia nobilis TaxID=56998 RepID=A0A0C9RSM9_9CONI